MQVKYKILCTRFCRLSNLRSLVAILKCFKVCGSDRDFPSLGKLTRSCDRGLSEVSVTFCFTCHKGSLERNEKTLNGRLQANSCTADHNYQRMRAKKLRLTPRSSFSQLLCLLEAGLSQIGHQCSAYQPLHAILLL